MSASPPPLDEQHDRPAVSVIVPFSGTPDEATGVCAELLRLDLRAADELLLVDNSPAPLPRQDGVTVVRAIAERSSYYARNAGGEVARNAWLLFIDGDCKPPGADLLDAYFSPPPGDRCGAVAGAVQGLPDQEGLLAKHARTRRHLDQQSALDHPHRPFGLTANLLVRRAAWEDVGGFYEGIRSGGDQDFSWRLQDAGWELEMRAEAMVWHEHRDRLRPVLRQYLRYGAGAAWLARHHRPTVSFRPPVLRGLASSCVRTALFAARGQREHALLKALDGAAIAATAIGYAMENRPPPPVAEAPAVDSHGPVLLVGHAPAQLDGRSASRIEAALRSDAPLARELRELPVVFSEDDGHGRRVLDLAYVAAHRPLAVLRQIVARRGFSSLLSLAPQARRVMRDGSVEIVLGRGAASSDVEALRSLVGMKS